MSCVTHAAVTAAGYLHPGCRNDLRSPQSQHLKGRTLLPDSVKEAVLVVQYTGKLQLGITEKAVHRNGARGYVSLSLLESQELGKVT